MAISWSTVGGTFNTFNSLLGGIVRSNDNFPNIQHVEIKEMIAYAKSIQMKLFDETRKNIFDIRKVIHAES